MIPDDSSLQVEIHVLSRLCEQRVVVLVLYEALNKVMLGRVHELVLKDNLNAVLQQESFNRFLRLTYDKAVWFLLTRDES